MKYLSAVLVLALGAVSALSATIGEVKADIGVVGEKTNKLDAKVAAFAPPGHPGTAPQAMEMRNAMVDVMDALEKGRKDVAAAPLQSKAEAEAILASLKPIVDTVRRILKAIIQKKKAFEDLGLPMINEYIRDGLLRLKQITLAFADALISKAHPDVVPDAMALKMKMEAWFDEAIKAFSA